MESKIKILFVLLCCCSLSCSSQVKDNCTAVKLQESYYKNASMLGTIKLFTPLNCEQSERLNKIILNESEWILVDEDIEEKEEFIKDKKVEEFFTTDSLSYIKSVEEGLLDMGIEITTDAYFIGGNLMTYSITLMFFRDKGSPYYDYINIDLKNEKIIDFSTLIEAAQENRFKEFILSYSVKHKQKVIENYLHSLSERADHLLISYLDVFNQPFYNLKRVKLKKIDAKGFSHFTPNGVVFNVDVIDENFLLDKERQRIEEYVSFIVIPYDEMIPYMKDKKLFNTK